MFHKKCTGLGIAIAAYVLLCFGATSAVSQEESPVEIKAYVYSMSMDAMKDILKDGVKRDELSDMQIRQFKETGLLPKPEPVDLKVGELNVDIPSESIDPLLNAPEQQVVVFFFDMIRAEEVLNEDIAIDRRSYAVSVNSDNEKQEIQSKEGKWRLPAKVQNYRLFDFRHASFLKNPQAVYELKLNLNGEVKIMKLVLNFI